MSTGLRAGTNNDGYLQVNGTDVLTALSSGKIGVNVDTPTTLVHISGSSVGYRYQGTDNPLLGERYYAGVDGAVLFLQHSRSNTIGTAAALSSGDEVGSIQFRSYRSNNTDINVNAQIKAEQTAAADNTSVTSTNLIFYTGGSTRLTITSDSKVRLPDDGKLTLGDGDDLQIYHNQNHSYIDDAGEGNLYIRASEQLQLGRYTGETYIRCTNNNDVKLFYDNTEKLATTTTGAKVTGALEITQEYPTVRPTLDLNFAATKTLDRRITFRRDGVGTYVDDMGIIKYASNNVPRFDHDPTTGESLGLLIEESRTNILGLSTDLTDNNGTDWDAVNGTIAVNQTTAPDGTTTAASFTASAGNAEHSVVFSELVPTGNITASVWVKTNTYSIVSFVLYGEGNSLVSYNLSTATVYNQGSNVSRATITEYPNGWYRISATMNCTVSNSRVYRLYASTGNFNASGSESFYYWGPQVESGSFETSYIPTYASNTSVTRTVDTAIIRGTNFSDFYNSSASTLFVEGKLSGTTSTGQYPFVAFEVESNNNRNSSFAITRRSGQGVRAVNYDSSGTQDLDITSSAWDGGSFRKFAYALDDSGSSAILVDNGTVIGSDSSYATNSLSTVDILRFGDHNSGGMINFNVTIKSFKYYNKRLSNVQLQGLTQQ